MNKQTPEQLNTDEWEKLAADTAIKAFQIKNYAEFSELIYQF